MAGHHGVTGQRVQFLVASRIELELESVIIQASMDRNVKGMPCRLNPVICLHVHFMGVGPVGVSTQNVQ